jgi:hypothetical protein
MAYDEGLADRVRALLKAHGAINERRMMGGLCFMAGDHMACGVVGDALMVRVGKEAVADDPHVRPLEIGGRRTAGFVLVDAPGVKAPAALKAWVGRGVAFAATLPPKKAQAFSRR